jgi:hypothetical protein
VLAMAKIVLALSVLALATLACMEPVATVTPAASPTVPAPTASPVPSRTPAPTVTADEEPVQTSVVRVPIVRVRAAPGGAATEQYVYAGQQVTVLETDGDWARIESPPGWVFIGCLEGLSQKGCVSE